MAIRRMSRTVVRSYRRPTVWGRSPADAGSTALAASTAVIDSSAVPVGAGETIVRVRGQIVVGSDQLAASESWAGAVGMAIVTDQAFAIGVGSVPTPYTDQDSQLWFMHQYYGGRFNFLDATGTEGQGASVFQFDSKAMRKFPLGSTLAVVVENAGQGTIYWLQYAVLFKTG